MNRYKYLFKNLSLLTIGNFASKFLSFLLVPLYTSVLSTEEYGIFELISTTITLLLPILSLDIVEGVLRFPINNKEDNYCREVFSIGLRYVTAGCVFLSSLLLMNHGFHLFKTVDEYAFYMILLYIAEAYRQLLLNFSRAVDRVSDVAIAGVLSSIVLLSLNIIFLLYFHMGLKGYFWASILSFAIADVYYIVRLKVYKYTKLWGHDKALTHEMIMYSYPIIFNTVGWWINNVSDRYIVSWISGIGAQGIYSVAYKIPSILNVFQAIFNQAWILSSVREFDATDSNGFFRNVYSVYNCLICVLCSGLIIFIKIIARVLFAKEFYWAWVYSPWLTIAVIFGTLSGVIGGVFSAVKDSKMFALSTGIGAIVNLILNIIWVKSWGPIGAAIATLVSAVIVWVIRAIHAKKYIVLNINYIRDIAAYLILVLQGILLSVIESPGISYCINIGLLIIMIISFRQELQLVLNKIKRKR